VKAINKRNREVSEGIEKAKFNYKKQQREKKKRQMQMTG